MIPPCIIVNNVFTEDQILRLTSFCSSLDLKQGETLSQTENIVRKSKLAYIYRNDETQWIFNRIGYLIDGVNSGYYKFNLTGFDFMQYAEYNESDEGFYDYHMDTFMGGNQYHKGKVRKLSLSFLLNEDYEGGEFVVNLNQEKTAKVVNTYKNCALVFPSFVLHKVTPVTKGVRKSIVVWAEGPNFI